MRRTRVLLLALLLGSGPAAGPGCGPPNTDAPNTPKSDEARPEPPDPSRPSDGGTPAP